MATKIQDILVTVGTYKKDGEDRYRSRNIGSIWKDETGRLYMQLDVLALDSKLVGLNARATKKAEDKIFCSIFDIKTDNTPAGAKPAAAPPVDDDDVPF